MILSVLGNKELLLQTYSSYLNGITSHQAKLNKIANLNGFSHWGSLKLTLESQVLKNCDTHINGYLASNNDITMFSMTPASIETCLSDMISLHLDEDNASDTLRVCNLFVICLFSGLHKRLKEILNSLVLQNQAFSV